MLDRTVSHPDSAFGWGSTFTQAGSSSLSLHIPTTSIHLDLLRRHFLRDFLTLPTPEHFYLYLWPLHFVSRTEATYAEIRALLISEQHEGRQGPSPFQFLCPLSPPRTSRASVNTGWASTIVGAQSVLPPNVQRASPVATASRAPKQAEERRGAKRVAGQDRGAR